MDDDVYLNTARLLDAARQWDKMGAQYVGCMKHGVVWRQPGGFHAASNAHHFSAATAALPGQRDVILDTQ